MINYVIRPRLRRASSGWKASPPRAIPENTSLQTVIAAGPGLATLLVLILILSVAAQARFAPPIAVPQLPDAGAANNVLVAASGATVYVIWDSDSSSNGYSIVSSKSADGGAHFSAARTLASGGTSGHYGPFVPRAIAASAQNLYVLWTGPCGDQPLNGCITFVRSPDGEVWYSPVKIADSATDGRNTEATMAVDSAGNITVIYSDGDSLFLRYSADQGTTFTTPFNISNPGNDPALKGAAKGVLVVSPNRAYVTWQLGTGGAIYYNYWPFTPSTPLQLSDSSVYSKDPAIAADDSGGVTIAWSSTDAGGNYVPVLRRSADGANFDALQTVSTASYANSPLVGVLRDNTAYDHLLGSYGGTLQLQYRRCTNAGCDPPIDFGSGVTEWHLTSGADGRIAVAWRSSQIWFSQSTDHGSTFSAVEMVSTDTAPGAPLNIALGSAGTAYITWAGASNAWISTNGDITPPTFGPTRDLAVYQTMLDGTNVFYAVTATDDADPMPNVSCAPASGSLFPVGSTTVNCTASDATGNTASASFLVTVLPVTPNTAVAGVGNLLIDNPLRATGLLNGATFGQNNSLFSWNNFAAGTSNFVDGKIAGGIGNTNIVSGNDSFAGGNMNATGRRRYPVVGQGTDDPGLGMGPKAYVIVPDSEGDVTAYFPNAAQSAAYVAETYGGPEGTGATNVGGNIFANRYPDLTWAMHPYMLLHFAYAETAITEVKILKATYTSGSGTKIYFEGDLATIVGDVYSSYSPVVTVRGVLAGTGQTALGIMTSAWGLGAHAEGYQTRAWGTATHAQGYNTEASGEYSTAIGLGVKVTGAGSVGVGLRDMGGAKISANNAFVLLGGRMAINLPDNSSAAVLTVKRVSGSAASIRLDSSAPDEPSYEEFAVNSSTGWRVGQATLAARYCYVWSYGAFGKQIAFQVCSDNSVVATGKGIFNGGVDANNAGITNAGTISGISGGSAGKVVCWKTSSTLGYCSTQPDASGACTCN